MLQDYAVVIPGANISFELPEIEEVLILRQKHIKNNGELVLSTDENYTVINEQNERHLIQRGDIIMATGGPLTLIGNMYQYKLTMPAIAAFPLIIIRPNENPEELYNMLETRYYHIKTMIPQPAANARFSRINIRQIREMEL
jgi:hypothetical protein